MSCEEEARMSDSVWVRYTARTVRNLDSSAAFHRDVLSCLAVKEPAKIGRQTAVSGGCSEASIRTAHLAALARAPAIGRFEYVEPTIIDSDLEPDKLGTAHPWSLLAAVDAAYAPLRAAAPTPTARQSFG
jgi:hypothetical protein